VHRTRRTARLVCRLHFRRSKSLEPCQGIGDHICPGPVPGESQVLAAGGGDELGGGGEQSQPQAAGLPETGLAGQGEHRQPGQEVEGELDDLQPDLVLRGVVEREVAQSGGAGGADAVLGPGR
jgi:hypothetical protein